MRCMPFAPVAADGSNPGLGLTPAAAMVQLETAECQFDLEPEPRSGPFPLEGTGS